MGHNEPGMDDPQSIPYLMSVYRIHGWDALLEHLSHQLTTERARVLCRALGIPPHQATHRSIAQAIQKLEDE